MYESLFPPLQVGPPLFQSPERKKPLYFVEHLYCNSEMKTPLYTVEPLYSTPLK